MVTRSLLARATLLVLLLFIASASHCPVDIPAPKSLPKPVAGKWDGELFGVRLRLTMTESGTPNSIFNSTTLGGTGWLVYGIALADSVAVGLTGFNTGEPSNGPSFEITRPNGSGSYGHYSATLQADGTLLGTYERSSTSEPTPSPWTTTWPAGTTRAELHMTKQ